MNTFFSLVFSSIAFSLINPLSFYISFHSLYLIHYYLFLSPLFIMLAHKYIIISFSLPCLSCLLTSTLFSLSTYLNFCASCICNECLSLSLYFINIISIDLSTLPSVNHIFFQLKVSLSCLNSPSLYFSPFLSIHLYLSISLYVSFLAKKLFSALFMLSFSLSFFYVQMPTSLLSYYNCSNCWSFLLSSNLSLFFFLFLCNTHTHTKQEIIIWGR